MLVTLNEILKIADNEGNAVGAFNCTSLECVMSVIEAAEKCGRPVILQYAQLHKTYISLEVIVPIMLQFAENASIPVCVLFDHGESVESCKSAIDAGFTSVMFDGSSLPYEENVQRTREVVAYAHERDASVEAELEHIFASKIGAGERSVAAEVSGEDAYTDPDMARDFVVRTNVDALAIAFGTTHGVYLDKPVLDLGRISLVRDRVDVPLVMHGGSGLGKEEYQTAIKNGIRKVNYYTYMAMAGGHAVANAVRKAENDIYFFHDMTGIAMEAMKTKVKEEIDIFNL